MFCCSDDDSDEENAGEKWWVSPFLSFLSICSVFSRFSPFSHNLVLCGFDFRRVLRCVRIRFVPQFLLGREAKVPVICVPFLLSLSFLSRRFISSKSFRRPPFSLYLILSSLSRLSTPSEMSCGLFFSILLNPSHQSLFSLPYVVCFRNGCPLTPSLTALTCRFFGCD